MAGFDSVRSLVDAEVAGKSRFSTWRKTPSQTTFLGIWFDMSMSPGNPNPQYYAAAPMTATTLSQSADGGIYHGGSVSPEKKFLRKVMALTTTSATAVPIPMILCDYLLFYPFVDESAIGDVQSMTNSNTLPRYTDGEGVQIMAVVVAGHSVGAGTFFTVNYTNQDGVSNRNTVSAQLNAQFVNGTIITSASSGTNRQGPFLCLQNGDTGVRSIESVTMTGIPEVGLFSLVLVKPIAQMSIRGLDAPVEVDYFKDFGGGMPVIEDNAYLNFICHPPGSVNGSLFHGYIETVWG
mgnify:CR=1 FL=1